MRVEPVLHCYIQGLCEFSLLFEVDSAECGKVYQIKTQNAREDLLPAKFTVFSLLEN